MDEAGNVDGAVAVHRIARIAEVIQQFNQGDLNAREALSRIGDTVSPVVRVGKQHVPEIQT